LMKEADAASAERLETLRAEMAGITEQLSGLKASWMSEKEVIEGAQRVKAELDAARTDEERATREGDLQRAAEIRYGRIPDLERQLTESGARLAQLQESGAMLNEEVTEGEIAEVVGAWTGIPVARLMQGEMAKLATLEEHLHERVIGQDEAVTAVAGAIRRSRAGLSDPDRPIGSFLFLGPTGVGKTELAKTLAAYLFDDERAMVRIDMSEYMEKFSVQRLIGAPPGYVGYEEGGQLTEAVRRRPYSVVLLDEIEKAHPDVFNVLLQVLDDGRLTDGQGRVVSFKNAIIIMTSNVGSQFIQAFAEGGADEDEMNKMLQEALRATFRPEFLNRIDDTVVFHALTMAELETIVGLQLAGVRARLAERKIGLELTPAAAERLAMDGFDPVFGARPLKRLIQREVVDRVAGAIIRGEVGEGATVTVDVGEGGFELR
ncbi:MAG: AAA family ATPase, partial [Actinobacteria bacterium]